MQGFLTTEEIIILKEAYRAAQHKKQADRIKTILLLNQGLAYEKITKLLLLDDSTLEAYLDERVRPNAETVCAWVKEQFNIQYSVEGMMNPLTFSFHISSL